MTRNRVSRATLWHNRLVAGRAPPPGLSAPVGSICIRVNLTGPHDYDCEGKEGDEAGLFILIINNVDIYESSGGSGGGKTPSQISTPGKAIRLTGWPT
jgi:hypothetical protein